MINSAFVENINIPSDSTKACFNVWEDYVENGL